MYTVKETRTFENCVYSYEEFNLVKDAQDLGSDVSFGNNEITAMNGDEFNSQIVSGAIPLDKMCSKEPLNPEMFYIFRKTMAGKYVPLHVSMRPKTADNILRGSRRYGSMSIDEE